MVVVCMMVMWMVLFCDMGTFDDDWDVWVPGEVARWTPRRRPAESVGLPGRRQDARDPAWLIRDRSRSASGVDQLRDDGPHHAERGRAQLVRCVLGPIHPKKTPN